MSIVLEGYCSKIKKFRRCRKDLWKWKKHLLIGVKKQTWVWGHKKMAWAD